MNIQNFLRRTAALLLVVFCAALSPVKAQVDDNHFIYIQSDSRKPFYVLLNDKLYSSSSIGYLIIPKLKTGTYNLTVGFPQNAAPEQKFVTVVKDHDIGYSLKSLDRNTYTLTDLQTQQVLTSGKGAPSTASAPVAKQQPEQDPEETAAPEQREEPVEQEAPVVTKTREETTVTTQTPAPVNTTTPPVQQPVEQKVVTQTVTVEKTPTEPVVEKKTVEKATTTVTQTTPVQQPEEKKNRSFGDLMSDVTNDPDLAKKETPKPATPQRDPFQEVKIVRTGVPATTTPGTSNTGTQEATTTPPPAVDNTPRTTTVQKTGVTETKTAPAAIANADTYGVIRTDSKNTPEGNEMSFKLLGSTSTETVTIVIPKDEETRPAVTPAPVESAGTTEASPQKKKSIAYFDNDELTSDAGSATNAPDNTRRNRKNKKAQQGAVTQQPAAATQPATTSTPAVEPAQSPAPATDNTPAALPERQQAATVSSTANCSGGSISDKDFNKLRNKMIGRDNDEDMISSALDALGSKCIETEKIKTLSGLFITDTGRLNFFNATYKNVSDKQNFASLEDQIYDKGKKQQFRNLINK